MTIERISSNSSRTYSIFDVEQPTTKPVQRTQVKEAEKAWAYLAPEVIGMIAPHPQKNESTLSRPKLEAPKLDPSKLPLVMEEVNEKLVHPVDEEEASDNALLKMLIECSTKQQSLRETGNILTYDSIVNSQVATKAARKEFLDTTEDIINRTKANEAVDWVSWVFWGGVVAAGVASVVITIATAGTALPAAGAAFPAVLAGLNALLGVGSGGLSIASGVLKYQNSVDEGHLIEVQLERHLSMDKIRQGSSEMKQSMEAIAETWKELAQVINNLYAASVGK